MEYIWPSTTWLSVMTNSPTTQVLMLLGCMAALLGHLVLLNASDQLWAQTPISALSQAGQHAQHALVLAIIGCTQGLLALRVNYPGAGLLTRCIQALCLATGLLVAGLGYFFRQTDSTLDTLMLAIVASLVGIIMSGLLARNLNTGYDFHRGKRVYGVFLLVWLMLIPAFLLVDANTIGAYQRLVGGVYLLWLFTLALPIRKA